MSARGIRRGKSLVGVATPTNAPVYVDSDDNKLKYVPAGSGTTEVEVLDASATQTLTNKTLTAPTIATPAISDPTITGTVTDDAAIKASIKLGSFDIDNGTTGSTLTSVTGWSWSVVAGATYRFRLRIPYILQTTNGGSKAAFKLTTATLTSVNLRVKQSTDTDNTEAISTNFTTATDQATWFDQKAVVYTQVEVDGVIVVNAAGTLAVQFAQNTAHADNTTVVNGMAELIRVA